jgi:hypothetical protein
MSRMLQLLRKPTGATVAVAAVLLVVLYAYSVFRPHHDGAGAALHVPPTAAGSPTATNTDTGGSDPTGPVPTGPPPTGPPPTSALPPSAGGGAASSTPPPRTAPPTGSKVIAWLMEYAPGGSGGGASSLSAYYFFSRAACEDLADEAPQLTEPFRTLYESAGAACMAAFRGMPEQWAHAEDDFSRLDANTTAFECFDRDAYAMLQSLIDFHRQFPGYRIARGQPSTSRTSCPRITEIIPDHGPLQGGQQVEVRGVNLPATLVVDFGSPHDSASPVLSRNGVEATVTTPASDSPWSALVSVDGFGYASDTYYTYDDPETAAPSGPP